MHSRADAVEHRAAHPSGHMMSLSPASAITSYNYSDILYSAPDIDASSQAVVLPDTLHSSQESLGDLFSPLSHGDTSLSEHSVASSSDTAFDAGSPQTDFRLSSTGSAPTPTNTSKARRKRPKVELAPNQPLTTQGKPRTRVFSACLQCRSRKTRCDGGRPACHNCITRPSDDVCTYDATPNRRGPDREPGARQRIKDRPFEPRRRRRRVSETKRSDFAEDESQITSPTVTSTRLSQESEHNCDPGPSNVLSETLPALDVPNLSLLDSPNRMNDLSDVLSTPLYPQDFNPARKTGFFDPYVYPAYMIPLECEDYEGGDAEDTIVDGPSLAFSRQTWWDALLSNYARSDVSYHPPTLTSVERESITQEILEDMRFLFRSTHYWFSFFNVPHFFAAFSNREKRIEIQPSLVLAALAISTFLRSSEVDKGAKGRKKAMRLREEAQGALEASLNAGWLNESLVQAAWLIAFFEICAHPNHSTQRVISAMVMLDSLVRSMSLSTIDSDNPRATRFLPGSPPIVSSQQHDRGLVADSPSNTARCECADHSLGNMWPLARSITPLWLSTPAWAEAMSEAELAKEQCRRLVWSCVMLVAGHTSYSAAHQQVSGLDLFLLDPCNYALLFPGESLASNVIEGKNSVWSLYLRAMMLWNSCLKMRHDANATDSEKAKYAMMAWLESHALDDSLNKHTCNLERSYMFLGREYLFNTRMSISYEFQRFVPYVNANVNVMFHRPKAEEWLTHQAAVVKHLMQGLSRVTGQAGGSIVHRPFFVFWFTGQISRALTLWSCDNTLTIALDVSKAMMAPVEYLMALFPCNAQRMRYESLRDRLERACITACVPLPS